MEDKINLLLGKDHIEIVEALTDLDKESIRRLRAATGDALISKA